MTLAECTMDFAVTIYLCGIVTTCPWIFLVRVTDKAARSMDPVITARVVLGLELF